MSEVTLESVDGSTEPEFASVLMAAQAGGAWALTILYEQLAPQVSGYFRGQGATDPDGSANEVFLRAFTKVGEFSGDAANFRSWIFTIAHNTMIDERRRKARRVSEVFSAAPPESSVHTPSAEDVAMSGIAHDGVIALLSRLPADQREVLMLRLVADLTVTQVADAIGRSPGAVKALQRRALRNLKKWCDGQGAPL